MPAWRDAGPQVRAAVCVEIVDRINRRSFEIANAVMHTSGQPFVMSFQAGGPHAQDRAIEAVAAGLVEQERVPTSVVWEKPGKDREGKPAPLRMQKDYRIVPRGVALVIGCNTFPTWNAYPGIFASLVTGNPVVVKPHPRAVLPLAISVEIARAVLEEAGFDPALVQLAAEADGQGLAKTLAERDEVAIIDYTGGPELRRLARAGGARQRASSSTPRRPASTRSSSTRPTTCAACSATSPSRSPSTPARCAPRRRTSTSPRAASTPTRATCPSTSSASGSPGPSRRLTGDDAKAVELLGATVNDQVRANADSLAAIAADADGRASCSTRAASPTRRGPTPSCAPRASSRSTSSREDVYTQECFGPVGFLIRTASTEQSLAQLADTVREHGAMTAAVYSTSEDVLERARDAAADGGVALSENLTGQVFVNQTAAFSDYHGTGANPAANAAYTDAAFVAGRFRVITSRRHV